MALGRNKLQTLTAPKIKDDTKHNMGRDEKKKGKVKDRTVASWLHISVHQDHAYKHLQKKDNAIHVFDAVVIISTKQIHFQEVFLKIKI